MKLSFLIAGVQKGATTALHNYLRQHSDIYLPEQKELGFFNNEKVDWTSPPYDCVYHSHFTDYVPGSAVCGEATPIYTYWQPSMARIQSYNPDIKLIVSFRDPVARAYSAWRMVYSWNMDPLSFSEAIRKGRQRVLDQAEIPGQHRLFSYVERGFYTEQITRIYSYFPREQVLFLTSYDLLHQQEKVLNQVCDFLGITRFRTLPQQKLIFSHKMIESIALTPKLSDIEYLRSLFREDFEQTQELIGCKIEPEYV